MGKPGTIDAYIAAADPAARPHLLAIRACLKAAAPEAGEGVKWGSPAFIQGRILFTFHAFKTFLAFAPTPAIVRAFADRLGDWETTAGTVKFPYDRALPTGLIAEMAAARLVDVIENDARWM